VDDHSESSLTYNMIDGRDQDPLGKLGIIMNFNYQTVTWDTDNIPVKDRSTLSSVEALIEVYLNTNELENHKPSEMNILGLPKFLILSNIKHLQALMMSSEHVRTSM
jgi:hypothetical protein